MPIQAIRRKVNYRILWLIGLMYIIKNMDYTNAASVEVLQVGQPTNILVQLDMTAVEYNWVQSIYFISYIVFEVPSNLPLKRMTPRNWQFRIMLSWGIVLACHTAVKSKSGLYTARFFLGMMEAGMFSGIAAQLCSWYRSDEMGKPIMWMFGFQNCSGIVGSLLTYGISYLDKKGGLSAWQWEYIELRLSENAPRTEDKAFAGNEIMASLKNPRTYAFLLSQILLNLGGYGLSWQLPTVTTDLGFAGLPKNQLLNMPPAAASVLAIIFAGWFLRGAYLTRPAFIMIICGGALAFFAVLAATTEKHAVYIARVFGRMFYSVYFIPFWAWRSGTLVGTTGTAFTLAFQSCVGQVGGVIGPQLFQSKYKYNGYKVPFAICAAAIGAGWVANAWTWWLTRNVEEDVRRLRRLRIKSEKEGKVFAGEDV